MSVIREIRGVKHGRQRGAGACNPEAGFKLMELAIVASLIIVITAVAIPMIQTTLRNYRLVTDTKNIASQIALARMRAASNFTDAELTFSLTSGSYQLYVCNKTSFVNTDSSGSLVTYASYSLSAGNSFGYGSITAPAGTQTSIGQPATTSATDQPSGSPAVIIFNSRGLPIDKTTSCVNGTDGTLTSYSVYLTDNNGGYGAVSVSPSGKITAWRYNGNQWFQM
jgi:Tfp pilus assembly protein FimT